MHFIAPDPLRRTEKLFADAASGRCTLKTDYLSACSQAGKFVPEEPYEYYKNGLSEDGTINLEAPRKWRLLRERTGHGTFHGMQIVIYGECISPPLETLKRAVKAGDGTILATSPPLALPCLWDRLCNRKPRDVMCGCVGVRVPKAGDTVCSSSLLGGVRMQVGVFFGETCPLRPPEMGREVV